MRDVGRLGEANFAFWCSQANLVFNKADVDQFGWDYYVEFPINENFSSLNYHESPVKCKVQVKATDRRDRNLSIKLSSINELVKDIIPAFILFIEYDKKELPQKAFLFHIDEAQIFKVLKKIRDVKLEDGKAKLNKENINISYRKSIELKSLNGDALSSAILSCIPHGMSKYVNRKSEYLDRCGYEEGYAKLNITTTGFDNINNLIDVSLGLKESAEISAFTSHHSRFGVVDKEPLFDAGPGFLEMPDLKPVREGVISYRRSKFSAPISYPCKLYSSPFVSYLSKDKQKFRVSSEFMDLIVYPYANKITWTLHDTKINKISLRDLKKAFELVFLMSCSNDKLLIDVDVGFLDKISLTANCHGNEDLDFDLRRGADNALKLLADFDVIDEVFVDFDDFLKQHYKYNEVALLLGLDSKFYKISFELNEELSSDIKFACINVTFIPVGDVVLSFFFIIKGFPLKDGERYEVVADSIDIRNKIVFERKNEFPREDIISIAKDVAEEYRLDYEIMYMFDIDSKLSSGSN